MARLPCKLSSTPSQQSRVNNFGNNRNPYWDMQQTRHPAPPYVRNHHRHTDHTGEKERESIPANHIANRIANRCVKALALFTRQVHSSEKEKTLHACIANRSESVSSDGTNLWFVTLSARLESFSARSRAKRPEDANVIRGCIFYEWYNYVNQHLNFDR